MTNLFGKMMYTVPEIADILCINGETIRRWIKNNELNAYYSGSKKTGYLITIEALNAFLNTHKKKYRDLFDRHVKIVTEDDYINYMASKILGAVYGKCSWELFGDIVTRLNISDRQFIPCLNMVRPYLTDDEYTALVCEISLIMDVI